MDITTLILVHSKRIEQLKQCISLLKKTNNFYNVTVICQDKIDPFDDDVRIVNFENNQYHKAKLLNKAMKEYVQTENVLVLDSDRILKTNWVERNLKELKFGEFRSIHRLYKLLIPASDEDILNDLVPKLADFKIADMSKINSNPEMKSVFSGSTLFKKEDYLDLGGMDERFVGYGFQDTEMSYRVYKLGMKIILTNDNEFHLWHNVDLNLKDFKAKF